MTNKIQISLILNMILLIVVAGLYTNNRQQKNVIVIMKRSIASYQANYSARATARMKAIKAKLEPLEGTNKKPNKSVWYDKMIEVGPKTRIDNRAERKAKSKLTMEEYYHRKFEKGKAFLKFHNPPEKTDDQKIKEKAAIKAWCDSRPGWKWTTSP
ncbi:MAG: hypothetical protein ACTSQA_05255 [Candidatus Heimdallarchaeaceae archaeon]